MATTASNRVSSSDALALLSVTDDQAALMKGLLKRV
jgi:hypothetical protein